MTEDERDGATYAADIEAARDRLIAFASGCSEAEWRAAPLDGDPRPVAVVVDHVADSYEYLAGFIRQIIAGQAVEVTGEVVDDLNAEHAAEAIAVSQVQAAEHLRRSGAAIGALIASLSPDELAAGTAGSGSSPRSPSGMRTITAPTSRRPWPRRACAAADAWLAQHELLRIHPGSAPRGCRRPVPRLRLIRLYGPSRLLRMAIAEPTRA